ncbi:MAG: MFS transporter, partial [Dehalococcoidia bacterium]
MAVGTGLFGTVMDQAGVIIALPKIADHFVLDIPTAQWINLVFILSTSALIMPLGRLSDIVGGKRVYIASIFAFLVAAVVSGTAVVFPLLLVARVFQGLGVAGIQATSMAIMTAVFPERERGKALGLFMLVVGGGLTSGPVIGGLLVSEFGWRSVFFASVPLGLIALLSTQSVLESGKMSSIGEPGRFRFDWAGAGLSSGALISFLMGMTNGHRFGWGSSAIISTFIASIILLAVFVWWQLRASDPMLDLSFFRSRVFSMGISARFLLFLGSSVVFFLMPFYLIQVLGYEAGVAGLLTVPWAVGMGVMVSSAVG